jgi:hypothetical protein
LELELVEGRNFFKLILLVLLFLAGSLAFTLILDSILIPDLWLILDSILIPELRLILDSILIPDLWLILDSILIPDL